MSPATGTRSILVVDDEPSIRENVVWALESEGFVAEACGTCAEARGLAAGKAFALAVLDIGLPDGSGLELCQALRRLGRLPVIFLSARDSELDRVVGLEIGGDDYVSKPFSPRELVARVRAVLRRAPEGGPEASGGESPAAGLVLDEERCEIRFAGKPLGLSRCEFRLLKALMARPGRVYSRAQLMDLAWDEPEASFERTVDAHIKSLRAKLRSADPAADPIRTHRGLGYSLAEGA